MSNLLPKNISKYKNKRPKLWYGSSYYNLSGLVFIANKHPNACTVIQDPSTLSSSFATNTDEFTFTWIVKPTDIPIENPTWKQTYSSGSLFYPTNKFWKKIFQNCTHNSSIEFIIFSLAIRSQEEKNDQLFNHANYLIFNKKQQTVFRYEPLGYRNTEFSGLDTSLEKLATKLNYSYIPLHLSCPRRGFQSFEISDPRQNYGPGFCSIWGVFFLDVMLSNPSIPPLDIQNQLIKELNSDSKQFRDLIQQYVLYFLDNTFNNLQQIPSLLARYNENGEIISNKEFKRRVSSQCTYIGDGLKFCMNYLTKPKKPVLRTPVSEPILRFD